MENNQQFAVVIIEHNRVRLVKLYDSMIEANKLLLNLAQKLNGIELTKDQRKQIILQSLFDGPNGLSLPVKSVQILRLNQEQKDER